MKKQGTIRWPKKESDRGFGFIAPTDGGPDVLLHINLCKPLGFEPLNGMLVDFEAVDNGDKGHKATWVREIGK